jgi:hypothetical protein
VHILKRQKKLRFLEKQGEAKSKSMRRKIIKIRAQINKIETKKKKPKPYKESMKQKTGSLKK